MKSHRLRRLSGPLALLFLIAAPVAAHAQIGALRDAAKKVGGKLPDASILYSKPPITTGLPDAVPHAEPGMDGLIPGTELVIQEELHTDDADLDVEDRRTGEDSEIEVRDGYAALERSESGGFVLAPGFYRFENQSYCLKAGTHGPGGGDGYLFAPPEGPAQVAITTILRVAVDKPEIEQRDIQLLLWAIIAKTKFEDLDPRLKAVAAQLLTPRALVELNRSALDILPGPVMQQLLEKVPDELRSIVEAESRLRQMLTNPGASFEQMEAVAVLAGMAPQGPGSREVPLGRWSLHPDGYYVRYIPSGYSHTRVEIWVPQESDAVGRVYDPALHIAVPGNTARQRLIQSARPYGS